jgi:hypothetical protein
VSWMGAVLYFARLETLNIASKALLAAFQTLFNSQYIALLRAVAIMAKEVWDVHLSLAKKGYLSWQPPDLKVSSPCLSAFCHCLLK